MRLFGGAGGGSQNNTSNFEDTGLGLKPLPAPAAQTSAPSGHSPAQSVASAAHVAAPVSDSDSLAFARERWIEEKTRYERSRLDTEFSDALNRLADIQNPFMRAGGANRVAAMARRRVADHGDLEDTYPYFVRASGHLAAALHLEEESAVRDEVHKALDAMTDFAQFEGEEGQMLLYSLIDDIAAANRSARKAFIAALARHLARTSISDNQIATNYDALRPLVDFTSFCGREEDTFRCLCDLADTPDCRTQTRFQAAVGLAQALRKSVSSATQSTDALDVVYRAGERLKETSTALTACLRALTAVPESTLNSGETGLGMWRRAGRRLHLAGTFLAGARLSGAHLAGANFMDAILHGADLEGTTMAGVNLYGTRLGGANLFGTIFGPEGNPGLPQNAPVAHLHGADWWRANPTSWRGTRGDLLKKWLLARFPVVATPETVPHWNDAPMAASNAAAPIQESPAAAAKAGRATGGRSVRALFSGPTATATPSGSKDSEVVSDSGSTFAEENDDYPVGVTIDTVRVDTVVVREKGLPLKGDHFQRRDLTAVQDLMADRSGEDLSRVTENAVQVRASANPNDLIGNPRVSNRDLMGVQDLMKDR